MALLLQLVQAVFLCVCKCARQPGSPGAGPSDSSPHLGLLLHTHLAPGALSCSPLGAQPSPFPLSSCQQEISWPSLYLCSMCLTTSKEMFLAVWPTLAGSQDTAMLCMDPSAMEPPLSCLKALPCTLTQVRKGLGKGLAKETCPE